MRRIGSMLLAVCLAAVGFAGCTSGGKSDANTLIVWEAGLDPNWETTLAHDPNNETARVTKAIVEKFENDTGKKLQIAYQGWDTELVTNIMNASISNIEVDVVAGETYVRTLIDGGYFQEFDNRYADRINPFLYDRFNTEDKAWAIPVYTGSFVLYVNHATLKAAGIIDNDVPGESYEVVNATVKDAGIDPINPATFEDMLVVCEEIKKFSDRYQAAIGGTVINDVAKDSSWRALAYMHQAGGDFANRATGEVTFDTPQNRKAFEMMYNLNLTAPKEAKGQSNTNDIFSFFKENRLAYLIEGCSLSTECTGTPADGKFTAAELPKFEGSSLMTNVSVGTAYYSIMGRSQKKELAQSFIDVMLSDEIQKIFMKETYRIPSATKILNSEEIRTEAYHWSTMETYFKPFTDPAYTDVSPLYGFTNNPSSIWDSWNSFVSKTFTQSKSDWGSLVATTDKAMKDAASRH